MPLPVAPVVASVDDAVAMQFGISPSLGLSHSAIQSAPETARERREAEHQKHFADARKSHYESEALSQQPWQSEAAAATDSKCMHLSEELRQHVANLQGDMEQLYAKGSHRQRHHRDHSREGAQETGNAAAAAAPANAVRCYGNHTYAPEILQPEVNKKGIREIAQQAHAPIHIDEPMDSENEEGEDGEMVDGTDKAGSEQDSDQVDESGSESDGSDDDEEAREVLLETWDINSARSTVNWLLAKINTEDRVQVLEELGSYYQQKTKVIEKDTVAIDRKEVEADQTLTRLDDCAANVNHKIDHREIHTHQVLFKYYQSLRSHIDGVDPTRDRERAVSLRDMLIEHAKKDVDKRGKGLPTGVRPSDVLGVVAEVQQDIDDLQATLTLDESRKDAYQHTLDYVLRNGVHGIEEDPIASEVIADLRHWVQESSKKSASSQTLARKVHGKEHERKELVTECDLLRAKLENYTAQIAETNRRKAEGRQMEVLAESEKRSRAPTMDSVAEQAALARSRAATTDSADTEQAKTIASADDAPDEVGPDPALLAKRRDSHNNLLLATERVSALPQFAQAAPVASFSAGSGSQKASSLFNEATSREFEKEFNVQQLENQRIEWQLAQFEELEGLSKKAVESLDEGLAKFLDTSNYARMTLSVGSLPAEAEDEDTKVLQDLKGFDEAQDHKQEEDHLMVMSTLKEREEELDAQVEKVRKEIGRLNEATAKEQAAREKYDAEIAELKSKQEEQNKQLARLKKLNPVLAQQKLDQILQENVDLKEAIEQAQQDLFTAQKRASVHKETFASTTAMANKALAGDPKKLERSAGEKKQAQAAAAQESPTPSSTAAEVLSQSSPAPVTDVSVVPKKSGTAGGHETADDSVETAADKGPMRRGSAVSKPRPGPIEVGSPPGMSLSASSVPDPPGKSTDDAASPKDRRPSTQRSDVEASPKGSRPDTQQTAAQAPQADGKATPPDGGATPASEGTATPAFRSEGASSLQPSLSTKGPSAFRSSPPDIGPRRGASILEPADGARGETQLVNEAGEEREGHESPVGVIGATSEGADSILEPLVPPEPRVRMTNPLGTMMTMKKGIKGWMEKASVKEPKLPPEIQKLFDEEQKNNELAEQTRLKTVDLNKEIEHIEAWVKKSKDVDVGKMVEAQAQKVESEVPSEVLALRQQVKKRKARLQNLRMQWYSVRELAKRGTRVTGGGKEATDLRMAILGVCEEALTEAGRHPNRKGEGFDDDDFGEDKRQVS